MHKLNLILLALICTPLMSMEPDQASLNKELCNALFFRKEFDPAAIQKLIDAGADINQEYDLTYNPTRTILHWAASFGKSDQCKFLLENGANPNLIDTDFQQFGNDGRIICAPTPLMAAIQSKLSEVSCLMIEKGADIHITDGNKQTALHQACKANLTDVCLLLIKKGSDLNACPFSDGKQSKTVTFAVDGFAKPMRIFEQLKHAPIAIAAKKDNYRVCRALLAKGALLNPALDGCSMFLMSTLNESKASDACRAILAHTLFPSKMRARTTLMCLSKMRTSQFDCPTFLYKHFKTLLAPYLLYDIAMQNKAEFLNRLKEGNNFKIDLLDPSKADQTIQLLIREEIQGIKPEKP